MGLNHLSGICGAAVLVFVLAFAPSIAQAHPGHGSHAPAHVSAQDQQATVDKAQSKNAAASVEVELVSSGQTGPGACLGHCCDGASHACCGFLLPQGLNDHGPVWRRSSERIGSAPAPRGLTPDALRKPPRFFA